MSSIAAARARSMSRQTGDQLVRQVTAETSLRLNRSQASRTASSASAAEPSVSCATTRRCGRSAPNRQPVDPDHAPSHTFATPACGDIATAGRPDDVLTVGNTPAAKAGHVQEVKAVDITKPTTTVRNQNGPVAHHHPS